MAAALQLSWRSARSASVVLLTAASSAASAHAPEGSASVAAVGWTLEPWVLACLGLSATLYAIGVKRLWRHAGTGRGVRPIEAVAFAAGWLVLVAALVSPLDGLGNLLFAAHMVQHELLMIVAAPLLVLGRPIAVWAWALPFDWRRGAGRFFHAPGWRVPWQLATGALGAWLLHAMALWLWHIPAWFDAALANDGWHALQHTSFLATALLFWWSVLGARQRHDRGIALLALFTTMVHTGALGALMTIAPTAWYAPYQLTAPLRGIDPLADQQLGGLIMWIPAGLVYLGCALWLVPRWIGQAKPQRVR